MIFLLDENVPISIKEVIHELGFDVFTLHDFDMLGIRNGDVAKLALKERKSNPNCAEILYIQ